MIPQKKKNNSTTNNKSTQLSVIAVLEKNTFIDAEIRCFLKVFNSKFCHQSCNYMQFLFNVMLP